MLEKSLAGRIQSVLSSGNGFVPALDGPAGAAAVLRRDAFGGDSEALPPHPYTSKGKKMSNPARNRVRSVLTRERDAYALPVLVYSGTTADT